MTIAHESVSMCQRQVRGVSYKVMGDGPLSILLLRGLGRWSDHWLGFDRRLAEAGFRVISLDNRGFGLSRDSILPKNIAIQDLAEDVAAIASKEAPQGALIVGLSLGGMIALSLASTRPQLVRGLMIINSSVSGANLKRISGRAISVLASALLGFKNSYVNLASVLLSSGSSPERRQELALRWSEIDQNAKPDPWRIMRQLITAKQFNGLAELASVKCPVTVIRSEGDLFVDPANSDFIHRQIKGSSLISHPTAGHELAFEDPDWLFSAIKKFAAESTSQNRLV